MIIGGRRMARKPRIKRSPPTWEGISHRELDVMSFEGCTTAEIDLPLVHSQMNTIVWAVDQTRYHPDKKMNRGMQNKNMRRYHRVHQPGFDTQRRPVKN
jgi:hypothetical protein